jgi:hypothetical protein
MRAFAFARVLVLGMVLSVAAVPRVEAASGIEAILDFLDHLSGPGPFVGPGVEVTLWCGFNGGTRSTSRCIAVPLEDQGKPTTFEVGPHFSYLRSTGDGDLVFLPGDEGRSKGINVFTYGVHGSYFLQDAPWFGLSGRVTGLRFSGGLMPEAVNSALFEIGPVFRISPQNRVHLEIQAPAVQFGLGPFSAGQFGAVGPELDSDTVKLAFRVGVKF